MCLHQREKGNLYFEPYVLNLGLYDESQEKHHIFIQSLLIHSFFVHHITGAV